MKKVLIVFGTRPEAIKLAPLALMLRESSVFNTKLCVTGQHRDMLDQVLNIFSLKPDFDLDVMKANQSLVSLTSNIMIRLDEVLEKFQPDFIIVHGDTTTTLGSTLSAFYRNVKICHVEAGLRTGNLHSPWPEEANRLLTGHLADINFCPTKLAKENLLKENINPNKIIVTGNTVVDSLFLAKKIISDDASLNTKFKEKFNFFSNRVVLITGHRRESFGKGFQNFCSALEHLAKKYKDVNFVYPVHLNPNVKNIVEEKLSNISNIFLLPPVDYLSFIYLMDNCYLIITDSGGIQEEAPSLGKPILITRDVTERPEAINLGNAKLVGMNEKKIINEVSMLLDNEEEYTKIKSLENPYGDGKASLRIKEYLINQ